MENWENVEAATESAKNSLGSAAKENDVYLDSIEGRTKKLTSTVEMFWKNLINTDTIKTGITGLEKLITVIDKLVNNSIVSFIVQVGLLTTALVVFGGSLTATTIGVTLLEIKAIGLTGVLSGLWTLLMANPIVAVAAVVSTAIVGITKKIRKQKQETEEAAERITELKGTMEELKSEYNSLLAIEDRTPMQEKRLSLLEAELETQENLLAIEAERQIQQDLFTSTKSEFHGASPTGSEDTLKNIEALKELRTEYEKTDNVAKASKIADEITEIEGSLFDVLAPLDENIQSIERAGRTVSPAALELRDALVELLVEEENLTDETDNQSNAINNQVGAIDEKLSALEQLQADVAETTNEYEILDSALKELNDEGFLSQQTIDALLEIYPNLINETGLQENATRNLLEAMLTKNRAGIEGAIRENQAIVNGTASNIKAYMREIQALRELVAARGAADIAKFSGSNQKGQSYSQLVAGYGKTKTGTTERLISQKTARMNKEIDQAEKNMGVYKNALKTMDRVSSVGSKAPKRSSTPKRSGGSSRSKSPAKSRKTGKSGSSSRTKKEEYKAEADAYEKVNLQLERNSTLLAKNKTQQDLAGKDLGKKLKLMKEEVKLNKSRQNALNKLNNQQRKEMIQLEKQLSKQGFKFKGKGDERIITNLNNVNGKTKEVEESFKRYITLQSSLLPKASQEWWDLESAIDKTKLDKLIASYELANQKFKEFDNTISDLAYDLKMLDPDDFGGKVKNSASVIETLNDRVKQATIDLELLGENGFKEGSKEAEEFANQQAYLSEAIKEGTLSIVEQERALESLIHQQREKVRTDYIAKQNKLLAEQRDRLQSLESIQETIVAIIRKRGEVEKKALDNAHKAEMDSLDKRHKERKKRYQEETDAFKKMIQDKIDALDEQYEEEDYLEELNKEREEANELQKQIDVLTLDDSLTARNKVIELRKKLADQNEKIAKIQQKKERDLLKQSLQDQLKNHEQDAKDKDEISDKTYENEKKRLEEDYKINKEFLEQKYSDEKVYAEARESIMRGTVETSKGMFEDIYSAYQDFENEFGKGMGILGNIIKKDFLDQLDEAQQAIRDLEYSSRAMDDYSSDYDPGDRDLGWSDPRPNSDGIYMNSIDFMRYRTIKSAYETYKKNGDQKSMNDARTKAQAIRDEYGIASDKYSYNDLKGKSYKDVRFKHGGLTEKTGIHILDGEPGKPERVLSQQQTKSYDKFVFEDMPELQDMLKTFDTSNFQNLLKSAVLSTMNTPKMPNVAGIGGMGGDKYEISFDVKGNMDKSILPQVERMIVSGINEAQEQKISKFKDVGIRRPVY